MAARNTKRCERCRNFSTHIWFTKGSRLQKPPPPKLLNTSVNVALHRKVLRPAVDHTLPRGHPNKKPHNKMHQQRTQIIRRDATLKQGSCRNMPHLTL
jgi:hypothetical protein